MCKIFQFNNSTSSFFFFKIIHEVNYFDVKSVLKLLASFHPNVSVVTTGTRNGFDNENGKEVRGSTHSEEHKQWELRGVRG